LFLFLSLVSLTGEDSCTGFIEEIVEGPREEDGEFISKANEEGEVNKKPGKPGREAFEVNAI